MTVKRPQEKKKAVGARGLAADELREFGRELCSCGHRAISHAALKYSCQASGDHKGYCPCMRFLPAKAAR